MKHTGPLGWQEKSLSEVIDIKHGFAFKSAFFCEEPCGDILLTPGNFAVGGGFKSDKFKHYKGPVPEDYVLNTGDLVVTMTDLSKNSDTLGYPALVPSRIGNHRFLHNQRLGKVIVRNEAEVDRNYLYYLMCGRPYRQEVLASATGTTVKHTSPERIRRFSFDLPPIAEQRRIAHILGALDDKIELNRRMNATLEGMARALFKSWFVVFELVRAKMEGRWRRGESLPGMPAELYDLFPERLVPSELGEVPEGWELGTIEDIASSPRRNVSPSDVEKGTPYIGLQHMPRRSITLNEWSTSEDVNSTKSIFKKNEILYGKLRPYFHKVGIAAVDGVCSTDIVVMTTKMRDWLAFLLYCVSTDEFVAYTDQTSTGTRMPRTSWKAMKQYRICLPPRRLAATFQKIAQPKLKHIIDNCHESRTLAGMRDALLPGLVSGEVGV